MYKYYRREIGISDIEKIPWQAIKVSNLILVISLWMVLGGIYILYM